jgi:hypothetical protein
MPQSSDRFLVENFKIHFFESKRQKSTLNAIFGKKTSRFFVGQKIDYFSEKKIVTRKKWMIFLRKVKIRLRTQNPPKKISPAAPLFSYSKIDF